MVFIFYKITALRSHFHLTHWLLTILFSLDFIQSRILPLRHLRWYWFFSVDRRHDSSHVYHLKKRSVNRSVFFFSLHPFHPFICLALVDPSLLIESFSLCALALSSSLWFPRLRIHLRISVVALNVLHFTIWPLIGVSLYAQRIKTSFSTALESPLGGISVMLKHIFLHLAHVVSIYIISLWRCMLFSWGRVDVRDVRLICFSFLRFLILIALVLYGPSISLIINRRPGGHHSPMPFIARGFKGGQGTAPYPPHWRKSTRSLERWMEISRRA